MTRHDAWLDDLLKAPHVDDDGFADRVAAAVPRDAAGKGKGVVVAFGVMAAVVGAITLVQWLGSHDVAAVVAASFSSKLLAACGAILAVIAAAVSGESLKLSHLRLIAAGHAPRALLPGDVDEAGSAAAVPTANLALKKPQAVIERTEDLDEATAREVVLAARKQRPLFGTIWFFFLAAPFILIAADNIGIGNWLLVDILVTMIVGGFFLGTPIVWLASRAAFFKECEQLGISKKLARRLRWRLSVANALFSPGDERDERAVRRLLLQPVSKQPKT
jgi:hypothetical protein